MLKIIKYALFILLCIVVIPIVFKVGNLVVLMKNERDERYQTQWEQGFQEDQKKFKLLKEPIFYFTRRHVGDSGTWVMVYPLDLNTKQAFLKQWQVREAKTSQSIECIKPTIKKRWRTRHSNIHYVQPSEMYKDHRDFKNHDSFIVFGSEKQIKTVEQGCMETVFKVLPKQEKDSYYQYWAIAEQQNLLFSVNELK